MTCADSLKEILSYSPETGAFHWKQTRGGRALAGAEAGTYEAQGYRTIFVWGKKHKAHRLAWLYMTGEWPALGIDHMDGNKGNNAWANLRQVTVRQNAENKRRARRDNKSSGLLGVTWNNRTRSFQARIQVKGRSHSLGYFDDPTEAHKAYLEAKRMLHDGCTI